MDDALRWVLPVDGGTLSRLGVEPRSSSLSEGMVWCDRGLASIDLVFGTVFSGEIAM